MAAPLLLAARALLTPANIMKAATVTTQVLTTVAPLMMAIADCIKGYKQCQAAAQCNDFLDRNIGDDPAKRQAAGDQLTDAARNAVKNSSFA